MVPGWAWNALAHIKREYNFIMIGDTALRGVSDHFFNEGTYTVLLRLEVNANTLAIEAIEYNQ